jgi:hypothetical protein
MLVGIMVLNVKWSSSGYQSKSNRVVRKVLHCKEYCTLSYCFVVWAQSQGGTPKRAQANSGV